MMDSILVRGIWLDRPASLYLDFFDNKLFILSSVGVVGYSETLNENELIFKQIKNNLNDFLTEQQLRKNKRFSMKDVMMHKNKIYVSFTNEIKDNCWNTSILYSDLNLEKLEFKKFFVPDECVQEIPQYTKLTGHQAGGRIVNLDDDNILFSIGDYNFLNLPQDRSSIFGKIVKINKKTKQAEIFSMGHRNPQGLFYDYENNFILSTEHGPEGGDEINLIQPNQTEIPNYGWPIASYGEHYGGRDLEANEELYRRYPLFKSHQQNGYEEPIKNFTPSIGISEIIGIGDRKYVFASLSYSALFDFVLNSNNQVVNLNENNLEERIRDLVKANNKIYLYLESTGKIGIINLD